MKVKNTQKKKKGRSVQELLGIKTFTKYGLATTKGELLFYLVSPTNISVLSHTNIEIKILSMLLYLITTDKDIPSAKCEYFCRQHTSSQSNNINLFPLDNQQKYPQTRQLVHRCIPQ